MADASGMVGWLTAGLVALAVVACGSDGDSVTPPTGAAGSGAGGATSSVGGGPATTTTTTSVGGGGAGGAGGALACEGKTAVPGETTVEIAFDGRTREYDLQIPLDYDGVTPLPLVFDIHGYSSTKGQQKLVSGFAELAESEGFIVVRPNGFGALRSWNGGDFCCGLAQSQDLDDVGLMRAIAAEVAAVACVHPRRIYATGISNGGALSHRLACEASDLFAAVAPVAYPIDRDPFTQCQPERPVAVMHLHGRADLVVPYDGSITAPSTPESFAYWGEVNGCTDPPAETYAKDDSRCETYESCDAGVLTTLCTIDGGHVLYANNDAVPVAALAWQFLSQHELP